MTEQQTKERRKLSHEILGLLGGAFAVALFLFQFLRLTAAAIVLRYCEQSGIDLTYAQNMDMEFWIQSLSFLTAVLVFVILFLMLLGQKISYLKEITRGVEALRTHRMDFAISVEGSNELTELAETINYLAATEREIRQKEAAMQAEKEALIRTLSHDIRTPLTSILAYSDYLEQTDCTPEVRQAHLQLIRKKAFQIKELTDVLLEGGRRNPEWIENGRLLMEQLAAEWEEALEEEFNCIVDLESCSRFSGTFDVQELRRIFDNLASNVQKYADPEQPVRLAIRTEEKRICIDQSNHCRPDPEAAESYGIGLNSIRRIAQSYHGTMEVCADADRFAIRIWLEQQETAGALQEE